MSSPQLDVLVIGAGVSGLTTAVCLAEAGLAVAVHAAQPPQLTTSSVAGAIWGPHLVGMDSRVIRWGQVTLARMRQLSSEPATGIRLTSGIVADRTAPTGAADTPPAWTDGVGDRVPCTAAELPAGYARGWRFTAPVISMPVYLEYLAARLHLAGGRSHYGSTFASLAAASSIGAPVVVNCAGIGARDLVPDPAMQPVRGQAVVVANPGISEFFVGPGAELDHFSYFFPHQDTVVLGGTEQPGDWNRQPDPGTTARILRECATIEPRLSGAAVLADKVGLRPVRATVRLEAADTGDGRLLLHNYGHGGAGVTLSWGCALDVARTVLERRS
jgi:D-amino-acid oxidase